MNYDKARENPKKPGFFLWCSRNDNKLFYAEPCNEGCEHRSAEEAERHFYNFCLESVTERIDKDQQHKCKVCEAWTQKSLGNFDLHLLAFHAFLCDEHRTKEELAKLYPFVPDIEVIHS